MNPEEQQELARQAQRRMLMQLLQRRGARPNIERKLHKMYGPERPGTQMAMKVLGR